MEKLKLGDIVKIDLDQSYYRNVYSVQGIITLLNDRRLGILSSDGREYEYDLYEVIGVSRAVLPKPVEDILVLSVRPLIDELILIETELEKLNNRKIKTEGQLLLKAKELKKIQGILTPREFAKKIKNHLSVKLGITEDDVTVYESNGNIVVELTKIELIDENANEKKYPFVYLDSQYNFDVKSSCPDYEKMINHYKSKEIVPTLKLQEGLNAKVDCSESISISGCGLMEYFRWIQVSYEKLCLNEESLSKIIESLDFNKREGMEI